ncbi:tail fiber protein [Paenibacillus sp. FSL R7-0198]|uniref:tail fiber protein n=1 Tax=Paenibacillus sp. FSL R7-0198 TaxID=2921674 RepID=UPI0030FB01A3
MPKETDRLKLPLPLGNENVTRESINGIFEKIDAGVATRESILIPAESDLNSYITEGEYYCPTNATVGTLANSPVGVAFHLTIERHAGVVQTLTTFEPNNLQVFQRNYYVGWGPWKKVPTMDEIEEVKVYTDQKLGEIVINDASLTDKGIVQLSNAVDGSREDLAATEKAVRDARIAAETNAKNASLPRTGGDISGPLTVNSWGTISSGTAGFFLMGHNCYIHPTSNKYYFKQTHSNMGARGIVFRLGQVGMYTFDTGPISTVKDAEFTPTLVQMPTQTDYDALFQSVNNVISKTPFEVIYFFIDVVRGNDSNSGQSESSAFKTINKALSLLNHTINNHVIISIAPGTYNENIILNRKIGGGELSIEGPNGTGTAILAGRIELKDILLPLVRISNITIIELQNPCIYSEFANRVDIWRVVMTANAPNGTGVSIVGTNNVEISNCTISNKSSAIWTNKLTRVVSINNSGSNNSTGLYAGDGALIVKAGQQPAGSTSQLVFSGGLIR